MLTLFVSNIKHKLSCHNNGIYDNIGVLNGYCLGSNWLAHFFLGTAYPKRVRAIANLPAPWDPMADSQWWS